MAILITEGDFHFSGQKLMGVTKSAYCWKLSLQHLYQFVQAIARMTVSVQILHTWCELDMYWIDPAQLFTTLEGNRQKTVLKSQSALFNLFLRNLFKTLLK